MSVEADEDAAQVEQAFEWISQGNKLEDSNEFWEASDAFCQAQDTLLKLSKQQQVVTDDQAAAEDSPQDSEAPPKAADDRDKIASLYKQQSIEYRKRARKCLVRALESESSPTEPTEGSGGSGDEQIMSDEEAMSRIDLFAHLYAKPELIRPQIEAASVQEQQSSLEDRLAQLNQSLPQGFKTSDERMRDINRGLNRLGLSLYHTTNSNDNNARKLTMGIDSTKSESAQVDDIIAQARDEVALMGTGSSGDGTTCPEGVPAAISSSTGGKVSSEDVVSYFESILVDQEGSKPGAAGSASDDSAAGDDHEGDNDDDDDEASNALTPDAAEELRDSVADAQASLAELMALLNDSINDEDSVVLLDRASAKQMLKQAGVVLVQATKQLVKKD